MAFSFRNAVLGAAGAFPDQMQQQQQLMMQQQQMQQPTLGGTALPGGYIQATDAQGNMIPDVRYANPYDGGDAQSQQQGAQRPGRLARFVLGTAGVFPAQGIPQQGAQPGAVQRTQWPMFSWGQQR